MDGKIVTMHRPANSGSVYYSYKMKFGTILLAVCDADYKLLYVDVGNRYFAKVSES